MIEDASNGIADTSNGVAFTRKSVLNDSRLSRFQKILLLSDGSVTELLCIYTGREIRTRKIEQFVCTDHPSEALRTAGKARLLRRKIMLTDLLKKYVYAESMFLLDHLSPRISTSLLETDTPIGRLWNEDRTEMYREIVDLRMEQNTDIATHFDLPANAMLLSRTYLIWQRGRSIGMITEKFPASGFRQAD
jgi:chorismate-pyruvate lyase